MMATVTFILGLCGAGKSWLASRAAVGAKFDEGFLDDASQHDALIASLRSGNDAVVVEIAYCVEEARIAIVRELERAVPGVSIRWVCFENDLVVANKNCRERMNKGDAEGHVAINERVSPWYTYPKDALVLPMWTRIAGDAGGGMAVQG